MQTLKTYLPKNIFTDARHFQIVTLSILLVLLLVWGDFAPSLTVVALTMGSTILTQFLFFKFFKIPSMDMRSPFITSLSLCLLFKTNLIWVYPLIGAVAMATKFLIRWKGKHIFNPANAAIVLGLIFLPQHVWISPGQWGSAIWLGFGLICLAVMVLNRTGRADMSLFFLGSWFFLLFGRALWLGDPMSIPIHNAQSGALLIFAFFMVSDPMTTPDSRLARFIFAFIVAGIAFVLQYGFQIREAIFYALFAVCFITPALDYFFKGHRYRWSKN